MKSSIISRPAPFVIALTLFVPACGAGPTDTVDDSASVGEAQHAYISIPEPQPGDDPPNGGGSTAGSPDLDVSFETCFNATRRNEMQDALEDILENWSAFERNLDDRGITGDHDCMHDRLTQNGNVKCDACDMAGHSVPLGQTANVCRDWAIGVEDDYPTSSSSRRVCWASVIMHEFGHTCVRLEGGSELVDDAARETLNDVYGTSIDFDSECNQDQ
ncbi:MAG TPA: hypothetical protein VK524_26970 [Polyangiaceae bacterium]|nr:hypothetical protein [Polyangiaceae bacterium]